MNYTDIASILLGLGYGATPKSDTSDPRDFAIKMYDRDGRETNVLLPFLEFVLIILRAAQQPESTIKELEAYLRQRG